MTVRGNKNLEALGNLHRWALCAMLHALCWPWVGAAAGFHTNAADMMTKMESLGEDLELFVASHVVEVFRSFFDRSDGTDRKAVPAGATILR